MFRLLAANVLDYAIFVVDPGRRVLSWGKGAERLLGFTEAGVVGLPSDRFFTPEDVAAGIPQKELDEALATGRGDNDRWHVRKNGSRCWAGGVVTPLKDDGGTLRGFAKIMRDRTDLKRAEDAARERERQLPFVTDHAPVLIAHCDRDFRFRFVNRDAADGLATLLRLGGHEVHTAHDGLAAVEAAGRVRPDVAILDLGMPRLTGYAVARRIRGEGRGRGMALVALTGWGQEADRRRTRDAGFDHHLVKPVGPTALMTLLAGLPSAER